MNKLLTTAAVATALFAGVVGLSSPASADEILDFGASSGTVAFTANAAGTSTTITGSVSITIDQLDGVAVSDPATLTLNLTSTGSGSSVGGEFTQSFMGTFTILNGTTNYLSGTFTDLAAALGTTASIMASDPPESVTFTSGVLSDILQPNGVSFSLSNVSPSVTGLDNTTLPTFTASIAGTFNGTPVPEPASLLIFGTALLGFGTVSRRRRKNGV